jgi:hypothetical protein
MRFKRGDFHPTDNTKRFWSYRMGTAGWVPAEKFEHIRKRDIMLRKLAYAYPVALAEERNKSKTQ